MSEIMIRSAVQAERASLEALQWRASLANEGDRDNLLSVDKMMTGAETERLRKDVLAPNGSTAQATIRTAP
jgi:hypothetical protein